MPKVMPEYLEQRRQQILSAAAACFARSGFHQTTMKNICEEAGLSPGAVYRYFQSKEEIIEAMCPDNEGEGIRLIRDALSGQGTLAILKELVRVYLQETDDAQACAMNVELLAEARRNPFIMETILRGAASVRSQLAAIVREGQAKGEINSRLDAEAAARVMMSLYQGLLHQKLLEPHLDSAAYAQVVNSLFDGSFWRAGAADAGSPPA